MEGALARGLLGFGKHRGVSSSCRQGVDSGCRLTKGNAAGAVDQKAVERQADTAAHGGQKIELRVVLREAVRRNTAVLVGQAIEIGLDAKQYGRRQEEIVADLAAADESACLGLFTGPLDMVHAPPALPPK
jgi:hypothetical protein